MVGGFEGMSSGTVNVRSQKSVDKLKAEVSGTFLYVCSLFRDKSILLVNPQTV